MSASREINRYFEVEKLVLSVGVEIFWYTNNIVCTISYIINSYTFTLQILMKIKTFPDFEFNLNMIYSVFVYVMNL